MKAPAFLFYVESFVTGVDLFTAEDTGAYIRLLCYQWSKGSIPDDDDTLSAICRTSPSKIVLDKFTRGQDGMLRNARLEYERSQQAIRRKRAIAAGKKSGKSRKGNSIFGKELSAKRWANS